MAEEKQYLKRIIDFKGRKFEIEASRINNSNNIPMIIQKDVPSNAAFTDTTYNKLTDYLEEGEGQSSDNFLIEVAPTTGNLKQTFYNANGYWTQYQVDISQEERDALKLKYTKDYLPDSQPETNALIFGSSASIPNLKKYQTIIQGEDNKYIKFGQSDENNSNLFTIDTIFNITDDGNIKIAEGARKAKSLSVSLSPVQSFNGYDKPWVGGAGKNLLHIFINTGGKTTNGITYTVDVDAGTVTANGTATANADIIVTDSTIDLPNGTYVLSGGISANQWIRIQVDGVLYTSTTGDSNPFTVTDDTVFGNCYCRVVSGQTVSNAVFKPMIRLSSVSDATYEPYENICPITGHNSVNVTRTGVNMLNPVPTPWTGSPTFSVDVNGYISASPDNSDSRSWSYASSQYKMTLPTGTYNIIVDVGTATTSSSRGLQIFKSDGTTILSKQTAILTNGGYKSFTLSEQTDIGIMVKIYNGTYRIALCMDNTVYEPYTGTTYPVSFGSAGTVYGGTVDVVSGVLTVDRFYKAFDGTETGWTKTGTLGENTKRYYMSWANMGVVGGVLNPEQVLCSHLTYLSGNAGQFGTFNSTSNNFTVKDGNGSQFSDDINTFKSWLAAQNTAGTPLQLCVGLATPQTYQLTPVQIITLFDVNNIWSDAGDVTLIEDTASLQNIIHNNFDWESEVME